MMEIFGTCWANSQMDLKGHQQNVNIYFDTYDELLYSSSCIWNFALCTNGWVEMKSWKDWVLH